jgi:hypothetical protein
VNLQIEATNHIKELLSKRGFNLARKKLTLPDNQEWVIFEHQGKQIGIDTASGVWVRIKDSVLCDSSSRFSHQRLKIYRIRQWPDLLGFSELSPGAIIVTFQECPYDKPSSHPK